MPFSSFVLSYARFDRVTACIAQSNTLRSLQ
jgi:hypothetical protein